MEKHKYWGKFSYRLVRDVFLLVSVAFIIFLLVTNIKKVDLKQIDLNLTYLILSFLLLIIHYLVAGLIYCDIVKRLGFRLPTLKVLKTRIMADFGRYIPGKVWFFGGRIYFFGQQGEDRIKVLLSLYIELISMMISGFFLGLLFIGKTVFHLNIYFLVLSIFLLSLVFLNRRFVTYVINLIARLFRREKMSFENIKYRDFFRTFVFYIFDWFILFLAFYYFSSSLLVVSGRQFFFLGGAYVISWLLGFLVIIAPAGLGVREGSLYYFLVSRFSAAASALISILSRIWFILAEIMTFIIVYTLNVFYDKKKK